MLAVIIFIVILGVLIFVHELGHFVVARRNGIRAHEFGFGFPPRIFGVQFMSGKQRKKIRELESVEVDVVDIKGQGTEVVKETITEKFQTVKRTVPLKKWRIIWGKHDGDNPQEEKDLKDAHRGHWQGSTIYSLNWIPLGGFVKIKGEDGGAKDDPDSFSSKSAWVRIKVLAAGVTMNFMLVWFLISIALTLGAPEAVDENFKNGDTKIQISEVSLDSPAAAAGLKIGDEILKTQIVDGKKNVLRNIEDVQNLINSKKGREINLQVKRGKEVLSFKITPRSESPGGQGPLGVALAQIALVKYPWYQAIIKGFEYTINLIGAILSALFEIVKNFVMGQKVAMDVAGPVGIAVLTKQVAGLGLVYILQFAALLSVNLGIINILPIPALDGGRILFIFIEKIKGSPVSQKVEQALHTAFFALLILLMVLVTYRDVAKFIK